MNFKNNIATTREQSERLLAMGLKPETADMCYNLYFASAPPEINNSGEDLYKDKKFIPAWSLSRLLEMMPQYIDEREEVLLMIEPPLVIYYDTLYKGHLHFTTNPNIFDNCVAMIDWLIRNGHFNKEYLIEKDNEL